MRRLMPGTARRFGVTDAYNTDSFKAYAHQRFAGYKYPAAWGEGAAAGAKAEAASIASAAK